MSTDRTIDVLKSAILLETRGRAFYRKAAAQSSNSAVKEFFETMAAEEDEHIRMLSKQFKSFNQDGHFIKEPTTESPAQGLSNDILSKDTLDKISAADFEAAAISAAMAMEQRAIQLYAERADSAEDAGEKELYRWLAAWEKTHLDFLADIDRALTERVWNDNQFWPF